MYYGASTVATDAVSYNGGTATNFYSGARPIVVAAVTDTSEATTDTTNPYVLIQSRNGSNSWVNVGGFQIKGATATTVTAKNGVITISSPSIPATRPNPNPLSIYYGAHTTAHTDTYDGNVARTFYSGARLIAGGSSATDNATSNTTNPYVIIQNRVGGTETPTWEKVNSLQFKGGTATTVVAKDGIITISSPSIPSTRPNPNALTFSKTATTHTLTSYDGSVGVTLSYNTIGAAPASGIGLGALDWTSLPQSGWTIPASLIPKEAMLDLIYVNGTSPTAATGVQVGDMVQTIEDNKLYYITAVSNGSPTSTGYKEVKVGNAAYASSAGSVANAIAFYNNNGTTAITTYNGGGARSLYFHNGLVVTNSATSVTASTASNSGGVFINHIGNVTASTATQTVNGSVKIVGSTNVTVEANASGVITIKGVSTLKSPNALNITDGSHAIAYDGGAVANMKIVAGTGMSITATSITNGYQYTFTPTAYSGTDPIQISSYNITHKESGVTAGTYGPQATTVTDTLSLPRFVVNKYGHITSETDSTITFPFTQGLTEGDISCTILGHTIYSGVTWDTF